MRTRLLSLLTLLLALGILLLPGQFLEPLVLTLGDPTKGWFAMVNLNHNAYFMWRVDHLSRLCISLFEPYYSAEKPLFRFVILYFGTALLSQKLLNGRTIPKPFFWLLNVIPTLLVLDVVGLNPLALGTLAWLPLLVVVGQAALVSPSMRTVGALVVVSLEHCLSANQAAIIPAIGAIWIAVRLLKEDEREKVSPAILSLIGCVLLVPALYTAATAPFPPLPDYPRGAHVVPDDGGEGMLRPLIGPSYPFESIHREDVRTLYRGVSWYLFLLSLIALALAPGRKIVGTRDLAIAGVALSFLAVLDTNLPEVWATIAPIASASRLLPWGTHYCLTAICIAAAGWLIGLSFILQPRRVGAVAVTLVGLWSLSQTSPERYHPFLRAQRITNDPSLQRILCSPSAAVVHHFAAQNPNVVDALREMRALSRKPPIEATTLGAQITLLPLPDTDATRNAAASESYWRWSTRRGKQLGDELLTVTFPQPTKIRGVELDPGTYLTDFPRGLRVLGGDCASGALSTLHDSPSWQGSLAFTPQGFPHLTPRNQVKVIFKEDTTVTCLRIQQTAQATFDWSISRVRIIQ